jgi:hypothetical protein
MCELLTEEFDVRVLNPDRSPLLGLQAAKETASARTGWGNRKTQNLRARAWVNGDLGSTGIQAGPRFKIVAFELSAHSSETQELFQSLSKSAWA